MEECTIKMLEAQAAYDEAVLRNDTELMKQKKLELQAYQSSLTLTAYMFEEADEIST